MRQSMMRCATFALRPERTYRVQVCDASARVVVLSRWLDGDEMPATLRTYRRLFERLSGYQITVEVRP